MGLEPSGNLQYYLLSATNPPYSYVDLHDRAFCSWMETIQQAFEDAKHGDSSHLHDDFVRQNVVSCLCVGDEVVATFLHSFASIYTQATRTFRYMKESYPELFFQKLKKLNIKNVMTSHYLAVHPEWRKGRHDIQVATVMIGLAQRIRDLYEMDAFIGVYRRDRKVHDLAYALGGECIIANVSNHNTPCDLILMNKDTPYQYPSQEVEKQISRLWKNRIDTLNTRSLSDRKAG